MFLQKLVLENVRSIERLELPFLDEEGEVRRWTFILGENGCGKSTILRAAALLLAGSDALPELLGDPDSWIRNGKDECVISADLVTAKKEVRSVKLRLRRGERLKDIFQRNSETLDILDRTFSHGAKNYLTIGYGVSRHLSDDKSISSLNSIMYRHPSANSVATLFNPDATLNSLEQWAMDWDYKTSGEGVELIKSVINNLLPGVEFEKIDKENRQMLFKTSSDGTVPLAYLSDGYQNVIAWCGDLLYRLTSVFRNYKNPFDARVLLLIDEIDLHLHPVWKRKLVEFLNERLPNFQIVCTTHSALTVHQAGAGELFVLRRETPDEPPTLTQYEGAPRDLKLQQLLVSPLFGLESSDSLPVEKLKNRYRELKSRADLPASDAGDGFESLADDGFESEIKQIEDEIKQIPTSDYYNPQEEKQMELLKEIQQALKNK